jgi:hypothetical protein
MLSCESNKHLTDHGVTLQKTWIFAYFNFRMFIFIALGIKIVVF